MSEPTSRSPTNSLPSQPVPTTRNKLKIYQWNADSICPKLLELRDCLLNSDIEEFKTTENQQNSIHQRLRDNQKGPK